MKKLLFQKFLKDTLKLFALMCFSIGLIVWVIQAVNFLDFITEDGHGLSVYFFFTTLNFPKIIHRIVPFVFFISLFYQIIQYESNNELIIFWTNGINKLHFINVILVYSLIFSIFQILLGSYLSPFSQNEARSYIRNSNIDFFPSLIKEGKFIDTVEKLTIFIDSKDDSGTYKNIFLEDSIVGKILDKNRKSQTVYAKSGRLRNTENNRYFELYDGMIIDRANGKVNNFSFKKIDFNLAKYSSKTTVFPKIQELHINLLVKCLYYNHLNKIDKFYDQYLNCEQGRIKNISQEVFKRLYKPLYLPLLDLLTCLLILKSKEDINYSLYKFSIFLIVIVVITVSEMSLRYIGEKPSGVYFFTLFPLIVSFSIYTLLIKKLHTKFLL